MKKCLNCRKELKWYECKLYLDPYEIYCSSKCAREIRLNRTVSRNQLSTRSNITVYDKPEEKKEIIYTLFLLIISVILIYFLYKWFIVGLFVPLFGIGTLGKIIIVIMLFVTFFGTGMQAYHKSVFYETHKQSIKIQENAISKIAKLKELKDKGVISKQEFEKKKKELLGRI